MYVDILRVNNRYATAGHPFQRSGRDYCAARTAQYGVLVRSFSHVTIHEGRDVRDLNNAEE